MRKDNQMDQSEQEGNLQLANQRAELVALLLNGWWEALDF